MINWIKKEYENFCNSKTVKLAYAKKLAGVVTFSIGLLPQFQEFISPMWFGVVLYVLGEIDNQLRKVTNKPL